VTSVVMGNCGFTVAPIRRGEQSFVTSNLERAEDIPAEALAAGLQWDWETFPEYMDAVDNAPKAINYVANVGHSALRTWAMGERALQEPANEDDIRIMCRTLREALEAGALGFTTSRTSFHMRADDRPVASVAASWSEVQQLVGVLAEQQAGPFELAQEAVLLPGSDPAERADFFHRLTKLAVDTRVGVTFGLPPVAIDEQLDMMDAAAAAGGNMFGQCHSRGISVALSFQTNLPFDALPEWQPIRSLPRDDQLRALRDPCVRASLVRAASDPSRYKVGVGGEPRPPRYDIMTVLKDPTGPNRTVAAIAAELGKDPVDVIIDCAVASNLQQFFLQPLYDIRDDELLKLMRHPRSIMTFSDSGAHVGQITDASIFTYLLAYWVRQRREFSLEEAIRMITSVPARAWRFADRGLVREGLIADLNIFDPDVIGPCLPTVANDLPGGSRRLDQRATGIAATVVGGVTTLRDGLPTGAMPGRLLRRRGGLIGA
ncbi:MAG: amidohydrolase family protein, partial [Bradyrhizobiaceae bacterium]|nr:amidohydrolase family protein [Bradyrhizobiaceae bacterium]